MSDGFKRTTPILLEETIDERVLFNLINNAFHAASSAALVPEGSSSKASLPENRNYKPAVTITKGHGGKLDFESSPGKGTTFIIHLPGFEQ